MWNIISICFSKIVTVIIRLSAIIYHNISKSYEKFIEKKTTRKPYRLIKYNNLEQSQIN